MRLKNVILVFTLCLVSGVSLLWWSAGRGPRCHGRLVSEWVEDALRMEDAAEAERIVLEIGPPAVPCLAKQGLSGRSHLCRHLSADWIRLFQGNHPNLGRWLRLDEWDFCLPRHLRAARLLSRMETNAISALPDLINCFEQCPECHYIDSYDLLGAIADVNGPSAEALPFFAAVARNNDALALSAAADIYYINCDTNQFMETCARLARKNPGQLLSARELFWFRDDHELNQHLVPLLEKLYANPELSDSDRSAIMFELNSLGNDARAAIERIIAAYPHVETFSLK